MKNSTILREVLVLTGVASIVSALICLVFISGIIFTELIGVRVPIARVIIKENLFALYLLCFINVLPVFYVCLLADHNLHKFTEWVRGALSVVFTGLFFFTVTIIVDDSSDLISVGYAVVWFMMAGVSAVVYYWLLHGKESTQIKPHSPEETHLTQSEFANDAKLNMAFEEHLDGMPSNISVQIMEFHYRAKLLIERANTVLVLILFVLILTATFIVFAGKIAEIGVAKVDPYSEMKADREILRKELYFNQNELDTLNSQLSGAEESSNRDSNSDFSEEGKELSQLIKRREKDKELIKNRLDKLDEEIFKARGELLSANINGNTNGTLESLVDPGLLLATGVTRLGVFIISIFLVQILINLYRYNTRAAAYYLAHADSLMLSEQDPESMVFRHGSLYPDIGYGKDPVAPLNSMAGIGAAFSRARKYFRPRKEVSDTEKKE